MTGYQLNKLAGAVLAALLLFFGSRELIAIFGSHEAPDKPGYDVPVSEEAAEVTGEKPAEGAAPAAGEPLGALLAAANAEAGAADAKKCATCHSFEQGGAAKIGPNLYGVVGRDIASAEGFQYSPALSGKEGAWTYGALDEFLKEPKEFAPGTKMIFPGVDAKPRADLIVYLKSISPDAPELPAADAPAAEAGKEAAPPAEAAKEGEAAEAEEQAAVEETEQTPAGAEAPQGDPAAPPPGAEAPASPPAPEAPPPPEQAAEAEKPAEQPAPQAAPAEQPPAPAEAPAEQPAPAAPAEQPAPPAEPQSAPAPEGSPQQQAAVPAPATASGAGNVDAGMKAAKVCQTCHAFEAGAPAKIGPNLHGIVGRKIGGAEGFSYSPALKDKGGNWDEAALAQFLENPRGFAPGTKMIYPGIKDEKKRADMIAYLKSLSP